MKKVEIPDSFENLKLENIITVNGDYLDLPDGLPSGLLYKFHTGIGATFNELNSNRNSIIVFPYRPLAWEKSQNYDALYVGTKPNGEGTEPKEIIDYILKCKQENKNVKFCVVAESLRKLINAIEKAGQKPYSDYFLTLDEVEVLQFHSTFRDLLPLCIEYFLEFERKCMVSATMLDFSNSEINKLEKYYVELGYEKTKKIKIKRTKKPPHIVLADRLIRKIKNEDKDDGDQKYLIGINSMKAIRQMINVFEQFGFTDISVSCSQNSIKNFDKKYTSEGIKDKKLHAKVNIATSAFWSGIDIEEFYVPYAVCLDTKLHHFFSFENLVQFEGRCRKKTNHPLTLVIPESVTLINFDLDITPIKTRIKQLEDLLKFLETDISSNQDRLVIKKALAKGHSKIFYEGIEENIPKVNFLLADLEKYRENLVKMLENNAEGLIKRISERFEIMDDQVDSGGVEFWPFDDVVLFEKDHGNFLTHLDPDESDPSLVRDILENSIVQNQVAAYWYLFGRYAFKPNHKKALALAKKVSKDKINCSNYSDGLIDMVRFILDKPELFEDFKVKLLKNRPTSGKGKNNLGLPDLIEVLDEFKEHFPGIFKSGLDTKIKSKKARAIFECFFELNPQNPKANKVKFKIQDESQLQPFGGDTGFAQFQKEFRNLPVNVKELSAFKFEITLLIRHSIKK